MISVTWYTKSYVCFTSKTRYIESNREIFMSINASCCCGELNIELEGKPLVNAICHCNDCKKRKGSAFGISHYYKTGKSLKYLVAQTYKV